MTGRTLIIECHHWRGFAKTGGPLGMATTMGFITVTWCPFLVSSWLKARVLRMRNALNTSHVPPTVEMASWGEDKPLHHVRGAKS